MSEENKENIEQKQEKQRIWNKILSLFSIGNLKKIWQKIWGKDLPEDITEIFPDDKSKSDVNINLYNKLKRKLAVKRFFISLAIIICSYIVLNFLFNGIISAIKNNPAIACRNKPVCIYSGPKVNYQSYISKTVKFSNGDIFVVPYISNTLIFDHILYKLYTPSTKVPFKQSLIKIVYNLKEKLSYKKDKYNVNAEIYSVKKNKFIKVKNKLKTPKYHLKHLYKDENNNIILYNFKTIEKYLYDSKKFEPVNNNILNNYRILTQYKNFLLVTPFLYNNANRKIKHKMSSDLYLLNLENFELSSFPHLTMAPKFVPFDKDIITLKNGKIIIIFRDIEKGRYGFVDPAENKYKISHVEIYDSQLNKFVFCDNAENYLKQNLFYFELDNGDVLFINKHSSSIFLNAENKFVAVNEETEQKIRMAIAELNKLLDRSMGLKLEEPVYEVNRYIKLGKDKLLITCGRFANKTDEICKHSVFFDYRHMFSSIGPDFIYKHQYSEIQEVGLNKYMFIGGNSFQYSKESYPNKKVQILEIRY